MGLLLFNLFINNLELGMNSVLARFVDDTTLLRMVKAKPTVKSSRRIE